MIKIVGDINFSDGYIDTGIGVGSAIAKGLDPLSSIITSKDDFWIGNFECVASSETDKSGLKARQFRIEPELLSSLTHCDLYGIANNHVMQHGAEAYENTKNAIIRCRGQYVGSADNKSVIFQYKGKRIGVLAFSQRPDNFTDTPLYWANPEYVAINDELVSMECDYKIIFVHWGVEFIDYPYIDQKSFAHSLVDSGADLVIGMHPHVLQGMEVYKGKHIFYSLGNCLFNMVWEPTTYSVIVSIDPDLGFKVDYSYIKKSADMTPVHIQESEVPLRYRMDTLSSKLTINDEDESYFSKARECYKGFRKSNIAAFCRNLSKMTKNDVKDMVSDFVNRRIHR